MKKVVQTDPEFKIETVESLAEDAKAMLMGQPDGDANPMVTKSSTLKKSVLMQ